MLDLKRITDKIDAKLKNSKPAESAPEEEMSAGQMMLDAIEAKDPGALEEAVKRCNEEKY